MNSAQHRVQHSTGHFLAVLRRMLARLKLEGLRDAAKALFGLPPAESGSNLTLRRETAAKVLGKEVHHFRKRLEPQVLAEVAHALQWDAAAPARPWASPSPVRPDKQHRRLPSDIFAWEATEYEEALTSAVGGCVRTSGRTPRRRTAGQHG